LLSVLSSLEEGMNLRTEDIQSAVPLDVREVVLTRLTATTSAGGGGSANREEGELLKGGSKASNDQLVGVQVPSGLKYAMSFVDEALVEWVARFMARDTANNLSVPFVRHFLSISGGAAGGAVGAG